MNKRLLLVVDVQEDFVRGSLPAENGESRVQNMVERIGKAKKENEEVIFTQDTHFEESYFNTQEGKNLPVLHCVKNTKGWEIISEFNKFIEEDTTIIEKSTFGSLPMIDVIRERLNQGYTEIELFGICTDICVINTAVLLKNNFPEVPIFVNASCSAGVTEELHKSAIKTMKSFQVNIIQ